MLPIDPNDPKALKLKQNPDLWKNAAEDLCQKHGISTTAWTFFSAGSSLVAAVNESTVIKIIQPPYIDEYHAELWALKHLPKVHVKTPELLASGIADSGWSYLIMTRVPGTQMDFVWPEVPFENRCSLLKEIGQLMSAVHTNSRPNDRNYLKEWNEFVERQKANCQNRHRGLGMPEWFVSGIPEYLKSVELDQDFAPVFLTGEYTPMNLLVEKIKGEWRLTGMVDFADSFAGLATYDLIGPGVFLCDGNPELLKSFFEGYGIHPDKQLVRKLIALQLLHRFSNFKTQVKIPGWLEKVRSFKELEEFLWPLD